METGNIRPFFDGPVDEAKLDSISKCIVAMRLSI